MRSGEVWVFFENKPPELLYLLLNVRHYRAINTTPPIFDALDPHAAHRWSG
jgi:hypothetical protein